jgi:hypothetical protein
MFAAGECQSAIGFQTRPTVVVETFSAPGEKHGAVTNTQLQKKACNHDQRIVGETRNMAWSSLIVDAFSELFADHARR